MKLLNKAPFKRGDVVRCVLPFPEQLSEGSVHTVRRIVYRYRAWIVDIGDSWGLGWDSIRFEKVSGESNETAESL